MPTKLLKTIYKDVLKNTVAKSRWKSKKKYSNTKRTVKSYSWTFKSMKIIHALLELISLLF